MFTLGHDKWKRAGPTPLQSTAGAVEVRAGFENYLVPSGHLQNKLEFLILIFLNHLLETLKGK